MTEPILLSTIDSRGVARLTLNRPEIRNAIDEALIGELCDAFGRFSVDDNVRVIVITGAGKAFSAGADLNMMQRAARRSADQNKDDARRLAHMLMTIYQTPKPTVALVNGAAMGGGIGLMAACDIAIGAEDAFFALSEVRLGLIPAVISPFVVQAMGVRQSRRYFQTGERFNAQKAAEFGLLHAVAPAHALDDALNQIIDDLLLCGPHAQAAAKELINLIARSNIGESLLSETASRIADVRASAEGTEGVNAFLEKRKPSWID